MKKSLMTLVLVFAVAGTALAQQPSAPQGAGQPAQPGAPAQKKEIKDPAEYNAYMGAIQAADPNMKAQNLEGFISQYPNSVMKEDALVTLMQTYQALNNVPKTLEAVDRVLQVAPNNVTALALGSYFHRALAQANQDPVNNLAKARQLGEKGLQALAAYPKPEGMSDLDFGKLKDNLAGIYNGAIGIAALQGNDYDTAQKSLQAAVNITPKDFSLVYPLALAYLKKPNATPQDTLQGIWYVARAVNIAPDPNTKASISKFGGHSYARYHGGDDGWPDVLAAAASADTPPAGWTIKPAPTPAEQAAKMCAEKTADKMSFDEIQFVLTSGNQQCADQVWNAIKDKPLALGGGKVITVSPTQLAIAESYDDINATPPKADITLTMAGEIPAKLLPKEGQTLDFQGKPTEYTPNPFMMTMTEGALVKQKGSEPPPTKKPPVHHTTPRKKAQ